MTPFKKINTIYKTIIDVYTAIHNDELQVALP
jgi:hypothetical protein